MQTQRTAASTSRWSGFTPVELGALQYGLTLNADGLLESLTAGDIDPRSYGLAIADVAASRAMAEDIARILDRAQTTAA